MAQACAKIWRNHGALQVVETAGEDLKVHCGPGFGKGLKLKAGETVVFSWIVYKSRAHRDSVNAKVMKDPRMQEMPRTMPFDMNRMIYGGFGVMVDA